MPWRSSQVDLPDPGNPTSTMMRCLDDVSFGIQQAPGNAAAHGDRVDRLILGEAAQDGHVRAKRVAFRAGREHRARGDLNMSHRIAQQDGRDVGGVAGFAALCELGVRSSTESMAKASIRQSVMPATTSCCCSSAARNFWYATPIRSSVIFLALRTRRVSSSSEGSAPVRSKRSATTAESYSVDLRLSRS